MPPKNVVRSWAFQSLAFCFPDSTKTPQVSLMNKFHSAYFNPPLQNLLPSSPPCFLFCTPSLYLSLVLQPLSNLTTAPLPTSAFPSSNAKAKWKLSDLSSAQSPVILPHAPGQEGDLVKLSASVWGSLAQLQCSTELLRWLACFEDLLSIKKNKKAAKSAAVRDTGKIYSGWSKGNVASRKSLKVDRKKIQTGDRNSSWQGQASLGEFCVKLLWILLQDSDTKRQGPSLGRAFAQGRQTRRPWKHDLLRWNQVCSIKHNRF